jgi:cytochrome b6-f complex iron-sulfur subunit
MKTDDISIKDEALKNTEHGVERRSVLGWFWKCVGAVAVLELGWISQSLLRSSHNQQKSGVQEIINAGMVNEFSPGTVTAVPQGQFYLARLADGSFLALSKSCTHLGCSVPWDEERGTFICPCHGSTFDLHGRVLTPPALRPLDYFPVLIENGLVRVDVTKPIRRGSFLPEQTSRV